MHALFNHRGSAAIIKTLDNTVSDYNKLSKNEQELLKTNLVESSPNCISCMAVGNRKPALRRTSRMKRTEQNVNSLMVESQHNEIAHQVKQASIASAMLLVNSPKGSIVITEDGELRVKPTHDASHIDSLPVLTLIESSEDIETIEPNASE